MKKLKYFPILLLCSLHCLPVSDGSVLCRQSLKRERLTASAWQRKTQNDVQPPWNQGYHKVRDSYGRSVDERRVWQQNPDRVRGSALRVHSDEVRNHS